MAEVRKGVDLRLGREVAVKRLRTDLASDATFQARFRREAQSAASLNHPSIVAVYDTGEEMADDGTDVAQPYIVMEYVAGRTLRDIVREGRKILPERALEITSGVLAALDYSHRAGIIHRDIKPGNVMLTPCRRREGDGLRHRPRRLRRLLVDDPDRGGRRHGAVPLPRAGPRRDRRLPLRRLLRRLPALRAAHRPAAVHGRQPGRGRLPARPRAGASAVRPRHRAAARGRRDRDEGADQAGRGPLPERRADARRHRALPRRPAGAGARRSPQGPPRSTAATAVVPPSGGGHVGGADGRGPRGRGRGARQRPLVARRDPGAARHPGRPGGVGASPAALATRRRSGSPCPSSST